ncbi:hypothetical protein ACVW1B_004437 [Bradyrhizobium sp. USDA 4502]
MADEDRYLRPLVEAGVLIALIWRYSRGRAYLRDARIGWATIVSKTEQAKDAAEMFRLIRATSTRAGHPLAETTGSEILDVNLSVSPRRHLLRC